LLLAQTLLLLALLLLPLAQLLLRALLLFATAGVDASLHRRQLSVCGRYRAGALQRGVGRVDVAPRERRLSLLDIEAADALDASQRGGVALVPGQQRAPGGQRPLAVAALQALFGLLRDLLLRL